MPTPRTDLELKLTCERDGLRREMLTTAFQRASREYGELIGQIKDAYRNGSSVDSIVACHRYSCYKPDAVRNYLAAIDVMNRIDEALRGERICDALYAYVDVPDLMTSSDSLIPIARVSSGIDADDAEVSLDDVIDRFVEALDAAGLIVTDRDIKGKFNTGDVVDVTMPLL